MKTSLNIQHISSWRMAVAAFVAGLVGAIPPQPVVAAPPSPLLLDVSFSVGSIAVQLNITNPAPQPGGLFRSTLHMHARDNTQTPPFNGDIVATGNAPDADTLLGGLLPAALIVKQDLFAGMTFEQAVADAQTKTGVTVTFFNDPTAVEYAVMLALIIVVCITAIARVSPPLHDEACTIKTNLMAGLAAAGFQEPPDPCVIP
jgi:Flp pilus assembly pilin Flp